MRRRAGIWGVAVVMVAGCGSGSSEPVPTSAAEPYVCEGVPSVGLERMTGVDDLRAEDQHPWAGDVFTCEVLDERGSTVVFVYRDDRLVAGMGSPEDQLAAGLAGGGVEVVASAPGRGYVIADGEHSEARWACEDGVRTEILLQQPDRDRDLQEDLSRYLVSILPWACGDEDPPPATP